MPALPAQWFSAYVRALPGVRAFLATVASEKASADLIPASGDQDHTSSPSALATLVSRDYASIASRTNVRDDRETPLVWSGMRGDKAHFSEKRKRYFRKIG
jgi:hypothetical protein